MKRVKAYLNTGFAGCKHEEILEFEDEDSEEEIEEAVRDWAFNHIEWGFFYEEDS